MCTRHVYTRMSISTFETVYDHVQIALRELFFELCGPESFGIEGVQRRLLVLVAHRRESHDFAVSPGPCFTECFRDPIGLDASK